LYKTTPIAIRGGGGIKDAGKERLDRLLQSLRADETKVSGDSRKPGRAAALRPTCKNFPNVGESLGRREIRGKGGGAGHLWEEKRLEKVTQET